jgi:hypothetical protein
MKNQDQYRDRKGATTNFCYPRFTARWRSRHCVGVWDKPEAYNRAFRNRRALPITETELKLMAAEAIIGLSSNPKNG